MLIQIPHACGSDAARFFNDPDISPAVRKPVNVAGVVGCMVFVEISRRQLYGLRTHEAVYTFPVDSWLECGGKRIRRCFC